MVILIIFSRKQLISPRDTRIWLVPVSSVALVCFGAGRNNVRASREAARGAILQGTQRRHGNIRKCGASKLTFPHAKESLRILSAVWDGVFIIFAIPVAG
jgi:hypothetical protein